MAHRANGWTTGPLFGTFVPMGPIPGERTLRAVTGEPEEDVVASHPSSHLEWRTTIVQGRPARFGVAGHGPPLVFLHGWGLGYRSYKRGLKRLVEMGLRVYAPGLPGLGGTPDLPPDCHSMTGYAAWVSDFLDEVGVTEPVTLVGHSFGGGVGIVTAYEHPDRVNRLVLVNSIGGAVWTERGSRVRAMAERPLWDWGLHFQADLMPLRQLRRVVPVILEDALPNLLRNAGGVLRVAGLARRADLTAELEELRRHRLPVVIVWGEHDKVIPELSFRSLRDALGGECITVPGSHGWLLADPAAFGEVMTNVIGVAELGDGVYEAPFGLDRRATDRRAAAIRRWRRVERRRGERRNHEGPREASGG